MTTFLGETADDFEQGLRQIARHLISVLPLTAVISKLRLEAQRLANEIGDAVQKSDRDGLIFIQSNLAHALLFQGHYDEALAIYRQYWDKPLNGKTFGEVTLEDFAAFDKAGLTHPDLSRMKRALWDLRSKGFQPMNYRGSALSPHALFDVGEKVLRFHFLVQLNGVF